MKKKLLVHIALALCLVGVANAQESTIGIYMDAAGMTCTGTTTAGVLNGSIWVDLAGAAAGGFTGAEFRVDFMHNENLNVVFAPNVAFDIVLGNPFEQVSPFFEENSKGVNMASSTCQTGRVLLGTFTVIESAPIDETWFTVRKKWEPSNRILDCAMLTLCDGPVYTAVCVSPADSDHWRAVLNPGVGVSAECRLVSVSESSWSQVKAIYGN